MLPCQNRPKDGLPLSRRLEHQAELRAVAASSISWDRQQGKVRHPCLKQQHEQQLQSSQSRSSRYFFLGASLHPGWAPAIGLIPSP
jgi:hypothetical protein